MRSNRRKILLLFAIFVTATTIDARAGLQRGITVQTQGETRNYDLYVPDNANEAPKPLVIMIHGHIGNSDVMTGENKHAAPYKIWLKLAQQYGFAVAAPNGVIGPDGKRGWNDCRADSTTNPTTDDVAFLLALLDHIGTLTPVDKSRVYATGTSNGGNMALRLAMEAPQQFAAVAVVVSAMPQHNECKAQGAPMPVLFMNGTQDPLLPYTGGVVGREKDGRGTTASTADSVAYWLKINGITAKPQITEFPDRVTKDHSTVVRYRYANGANELAVVLYEVRGGGHTEPSLTEHYRWLYKRIVGPQNKDIEMADEVWQFFQPYRR